MLTAFGEMEYEDYLRTVWWKALRMQVRKERGRCARCGSAKRLEVHHLNYTRLGREPREDLEVLCRTCHGDHHRREKAAWLYEARLAGWVEKVIGHEPTGDDLDFYADDFDEWLEGKEDGY